MSLIYTVNRYDYDEVVCSLIEFLQDSLSTNVGLLEEEISIRNHSSVYEDELFEFVAQKLEGSRFTSTLNKSNYLQDATKKISLANNFLFPIFPSNNRTFDAGTKAEFDAFASKLSNTIKDCMPKHKEYDFESVNNIIILKNFYKTANIILIPAFYLEDEGYLHYIESVGTDKFTIHF